MDASRNINNYLDFASRTKRDPQDSSTLKSYRTSRRVTEAAVYDVARWMTAQRTASKSAKQLLSHTRGYRRKLSSSWHLDNKLSAYISKVQQKFSCSCGSRLEVPSYNICKCGKIWNAYKIQSASKGDSIFVVREVPVRESVVLANKKTSGLGDPGYNKELGQWFKQKYPESRLSDYDEDSLFDVVEEFERSRTSSRRVAGDYDVWDDTIDFIDFAKTRGYTMPKDMGDPASGTLQDELYDFVGGDKSRASIITDNLMDNWNELKHAKNPYAGGSFLGGRG